MENLHILTDEQLVKMAQEGSETAEEILIVKYKGFVAFKVKPYFAAGTDNEDLVQEGMIGLFKAIRSFDIDKEAKFKTYADLCISSRLINVVKAANRQKNRLLNESISMTSNDGESEISIEDVFVAPAEDEPEYAVVLSDIFSRIKKDDIGLFSKLEKEVLAKKIEGLSYREIAKTLNRTPKSIDNAMQRIKKKVMAYFEK